MFQGRKLTFLGKRQLATDLFFQSPNGKMWQPAVKFSRIGDQESAISDPVFQSFKKGLPLTFQVTGKQHRFAVPVNLRHTQLSHKSCSVPWDVHNHTHHLPRSILVDQHEGSLSYLWTSWEGKSPKNHNWKQWLKERIILEWSTEDSRLESSFTSSSGHIVVHYMHQRFSLVED